MKRTEGNFPPSILSKNKRNWLFMDYCHQFKLLASFHSLQFMTVKVAVTLFLSRRKKS